MVATQLEFCQVIPAKARKPNVELRLGHDSSPTKKRYMYIYVNMYTHTYVDS